MNPRTLEADIQASLERLERFARSQGRKRLRHT